MKFTPTACVFALQLALMAVQGGATVITYNFSGTIHSPVAVDPQHHLSGEFYPGQSFTGRLTYDTETPLWYSAGGVKDYQAAASNGHPLQVQVTIDEYEFKSGAAYGGVIQTGSAGGIFFATDGPTVPVSSPLPGGYSLRVSFAAFRAGDPLPQTLTLTPYEDYVGIYSGSYPDDYVNMWGDITQLTRAAATPDVSTPEPLSAATMGAGLLCLAAAARKRIE